MKLPRISIKKLMAIVAMVAIVVAALARPNYGWANLLSSTYVLMLFVAPLGIILRRGTRQARWIGFGLFGWAFFLTTTFLRENLSHFSSIRFPQELNVQSHGDAFYSFGLNAVSENIRRTVLVYVDFIGSIGDIANWDWLEDLSGLGQIDTFSTAVVLLSLMGLGFALLGGQIARFLAKGGPFDRPPQTPT